LACGSVTRHAPGSCNGGPMEGPGSRPSDEPMRSPAPSPRAGSHAARRCNSGGRSGRLTNCDRLQPPLSQGSRPELETGHASRPRTRRRAPHHPLSGQQAAQSGDPGRFGFLERRVARQCRQRQPRTFRSVRHDETREAFQAHKGTGQRPPAPQQRNTLTFSALCIAFLDAKRGVYANSTLSSLGYYLDTQLLPAFGRSKTARITTPDIAEWFYAYSRSRPGGANQALGHFTTILNWEPGSRPSSGVCTQSRSARVV